jgi:FHA domain-containing protein
VADGRTSGPGFGLGAEIDEAVASRDGLAYVVLFSGDLPGRIFTIKRNSVLIGRSEEADIHINDGSVSSQHARIVHHAGGFEITDLDSTNGTFVGNKRVSRASLRSSDRVTVGNIEFMFLLDRPTDATIQLPDIIDRGPSRALVPAGLAMRSPPMYATQMPSMAADEDAEPSLADIVHKVVRAYQFLRERTVLISTCIAGGMVLGLFSIFFWPPGAAAVAEVKLLPHLTINNNPQGQQQDDRWQNNEQDSTLWAKSAERTLTQRELIRSTISKLTGVEPNDGRIRSAATRVRVEETGDHVFRATYKDKLSAKPSPLEFLTVLLQGYVQAEIGRSLRELSAKVDFLRDQLKAVERDLSSVSMERAAFREANADRLPEDEESTHTSRFGLETRRGEMTAQIHELQAELGAAEEQVKANRPEAQRKFKDTETYRQSLADINRKLTEAYARGLGDQHPDVQQLKAEKERLSTLAKDELSSSSSTLLRESDPNYQAAQNQIEKLKAELAAARANLAETERSLGEVKRVVQDLPRVEQRLSDLNHRQEATMQLHSDLFAKLKQAEIQLNLEKVSAESRYDISTPRLELPRKSSTLGLRGLIGLFIGLIAAAIAISFEEIRRLVLQTMGGPAIVPQVIATRKRGPRNSRY